MGGEREKEGERERDSDRVREPKGALSGVVAGSMRAFHVSL